MPFSSGEMVKYGGSKVEVLGLRSIEELERMTVLGSGGPG